MQAFVAQGGLDQVLDQLLQRTALAEFAHRFGMRASDRLIDKQLLAIPAFRGADGNFSQDAFQHGVVAARAERSAGAARTSRPGCRRASCSPRSPSRRSCRRASAIAMPRCCASGGRARSACCRAPRSCRRAIRRPRSSQAFHTRQHRGLHPPRTPRDPLRAVRRGSARHAARADRAADRRAIPARPRAICRGRAPPADPAGRPDRRLPPRPSSPKSRAASRSTPPRARRVWQPPRSARSARATSPTPPPRPSPRRRSRPRKAR